MFQVAFGKIGIDRQSFWQMTPREFFNAWQGYSDAENDRMEAMQAIIFGASRYNAANTAMSREASKAISRQKFPWELKQRKTKDVNSVRAFIKSQKRKIERRKKKNGKR